MQPPKQHHFMRLWTAFGRIVQFLKYCSQPFISVVGYRHCEIGRLGGDKISWTADPRHGKVPTVEPLECNRWPGLASDFGLFLGTKLASNNWVSNGLQRNPWNVACSRTLNWFQSPFRKFQERIMPGWWQLRQIHLQKQYLDWKAHSLSPLIWKSKWLRNWKSSWMSVCLTPKSLGAQVQL